METLHDLTCVEALIYLADKNFTYKEISSLLLKYKSTRLSENAIGKRLKKIGYISRKGSTTHQVAQIQHAIEAVLPDLPETVGYRSMTSILRGQGMHIRSYNLKPLLQYTKSSSTEGMLVLLYDRYINL